MSFSELTPDTRAAVSRLFDFTKNRFGVEPTVSSTLRTCDEQNAIFSRGRTTPGTIVTNARGCKSWHVLGRAIDIFVPGFTPEDYAVLGDFWERLGGVWGGDFDGLGDFGHFEWHPGVAIEEVCPNPDQCSSAVKLSRSFNIPPGEDATKILLIAGVVFGAWWFADAWTRKTGGYGNFRLF